MSDNVKRGTSMTDDTVEDTALIPKRFAAFINDDRAIPSEIASVLGRGDNRAGQSISARRRA